MSEHRPSETRPHARATVPVVVAAAATCALVAVASFLPGVRLWGLNHLAFYPIAIRVVALLLIALAFVPPVARRAYGALAAVPPLLERASDGRFRTIAIACAVVAFGAFFLLRSSTNLLGDGQLISRSFEAAADGNKTVVMRSVRAIVKEEDIAPGATLLYYVAAKWAHGVLGGNPVDGIRVFNCLLGAVYVLMLLGLVRRARLPGDLKAWLLVLGLFSASVELYFGYIENYTPLVFFLFLYVVSGFLYLHRRLIIAWPLSLLAVCVYTHVQAWVFAPSAFFLLIWFAAKGRRRLVLRYVPPILLFLTVAGVVAAYFTKARGYLLPLYDPEAYAILSPPHLVDVANEVLILLPILPVVLVLAWVGRRLAGDESRGTDVDDDAWLTHPVEWHFVTMMLVPCAAYLVAFDPAIGMARDWDLFGMLSVALVPWTLQVLARFRRATSGYGPALASFAAPALVTTVVLGAAWFGINASPWRTADRFESILTYDRAHGSYAMENLAIFYHDNQRLEKAIAMMELAYENYGNPRHAVRLAIYYEEAGRYRDAAHLMYRVLERHPKDTRARTKLIMILDVTGRYADMVPVAREGVRYHPKKASYQFFLGESLIQTGHVEEGLQAFLRCLENNPPTSAREHIQERFEEYGRPEMAPAPDAPPDDSADGTPDDTWDATPDSADASE